jgi:hypothetical protein
VRENLEAELGVLVKNMQSARRLLAVSVDEVRILQEPFELAAHLFPAFWTGIALQDGAAIGDELVEFVSHRNHS